MDTGPSLPDPEEVRRALQARLSPPRYAHSLRVAQTAVELAARHGLDRREAELAALLHDWCREEPGAQLVAQARALGLPLPTDPGQLVPEVLHGPVAARVLPALWPGLTAPILQAVDRHTTGDATMTDLDCLILVADLIEPAHAFTGAQGLRELAAHDLRRACCAALGLTLIYLVRRGRPVDARAVAARNALLAQGAGGPLPEAGPGALPEMEGLRPRSTG